MTAKTPAQRKADERARNKQADLAEVRGIIAPKPHHDEIKAAARKVAARLATRGKWHMDEDDERFARAQSNRPTVGKGEA